ncbi:MAG: hypothetical protein LBF22_09890 [Deltaproteobacteria bacterium]|nr:hypothetical protein [Deltaproteobacteria bacterium]
MPSVVCIQQNGKLYIYGAVSFRRPTDRMPALKMTCIGKIDNDSNNPEFNKKAAVFEKNHGISVKKALMEYQECPKQLELGAPLP